MNPNQQRKPTKAPIPQVDASDQRMTCSSPKATRMSQTKEEIILAARPFLGPVGEMRARPSTAWRRGRRVPDGAEDPEDECGAENGPVIEMVEVAEIHRWLRAEDLDAIESDGMRVGMSSAFRVS